MMVKKPVVSIALIMCLTLTFLGSSISPYLFQDISLSHEKTTAVPQPCTTYGNITILVDIERVRTMTVNEITPNLFFTIYIDGEDSTVDTSHYFGHDILFETPMASRTIPYDPETPVAIQIQLWEKELVLARMCDISGKSTPFSDRGYIDLSYDVKRGEWTGDDFLSDENGYGHCSGFEDGFEHQNDCEIWFDILQHVPDESGDRLTYWEKLNIYHLDPAVDYSTVDSDDDGIPCDWEDKYGYNPLSSENHGVLDSDADGLSNVEEYLTSQWLSDPFAQDIFIEIDTMEGKYSWSNPYTFPEASQQLLLNVFARHTITIHIDDDGSMGGGGELIGFDEQLSWRGLSNIRDRYFLHYDSHTWRRGVFHYAIICCQIEFSRPAGGCAFAIDSFAIGGQYVKNWSWSFYLHGQDYYEAYASVVMHELGHTLGLGGFEGIDNESSRFIWQDGFWKWTPYLSCMNYRYVYKLVDYSNGDDSHHDQDDWDIIDLARFST